MVQKAPPVDWRRLRGGDTIALPTAPRPPFLERRSTSEGDMRRGTYRLSKYDDHFTMAVVNDDNTPLTAGVEQLLETLLDLVALLRQEVADLRADLKEI